jgi:hypothetical protein
MAQEEGFEIFNRFYPAPRSFRLGDPVLVREVTGMEWPEFTGALAEQEEELQALIEQGRQDAFQPDQVVLLGLIAVSFWHGNPTMSRRKVVTAVQRIPVDDVRYIAGDEEDDAGPPAPTDGAAAAGASPPTTTSGSDAEPAAPARTETQADFTSDETNPNGSGSPGSPSSPLESLQA